MKKTNLIARGGIRYQMILNNLTGKDMAKKMGMSESTFSKKANGHSEFTESELFELNAILGYGFVQSCMDLIEEDAKNGDKNERVQG